MNKNFFALAGTYLFIFVLIVNKQLRWLRDV